MRKSRGGPGGSRDRYAHVNRSVVVRQQNSDEKIETVPGVMVKEYSLGDTQEGL